MHVRDAATLSTRVLTVRGVRRCPVRLAHDVLAQRTEWTRRVCVHVLAQWRLHGTTTRGLFEVLFYARRGIPRTGTWPPAIAAPRTRRPMEGPSVA